MLGYELLPVLATLSMVSWSSATTSIAINYNHICAMVKEDTKIAIPNNCATYYLCQSAAAILKQCPPNYFFDKNIQRCAPQDTVNCYNNEQNPCSRKLVGTFVGVPGSCSGYYYCGENKVSLRGNCPSGTIFDSYQEKCVFDTENLCRSENNPNDIETGRDNTHINVCEYIPNGVYFGSSSTCQAWQFCENDIIKSGLCPQGMVYNVAKNLCDYPENVRCIQVTHDPATEVAPVGGLCQEYGEVKADGVTCSGFFKCDGTRFRLNQCLRGTYFDPPTGKCVGRADARNDCDRCQGTTLQFVNTFSTDNCKGYSLCDNGIGVSSGFCEIGYFDEQVGACVNENNEPKYLVCNPKANTEGSAVGPPVAGGHPVESFNPYLIPQPPGPINVQMKFA